MQRLAHTESRAQFSPAVSETIEIPGASGNLYRTLQQEVELGAQALRSERADMAVTFFQSALRKISLTDPFYDHLVHNLLSSYLLLIEQLLKQGDTNTASDFLRASLTLEVRGQMADDATFLRRFAGAFQNLGLICFQNGLNEESVWCCRKAISIYAAPGSYVNLTNSLSATGGRAQLSDFTTGITAEQLGKHIFIACVPKSASTFLKNVLVYVTGYRDLFAVYAAGQAEHEIYRRESIAPFF
jgi:tetratricopeptide (TPR) repeat protein